MRRELKKYVYEKVREGIKKELTGHMGKCVETDEILYCYVSKHKIINTIMLSGIDENNIDLAQRYNLNKPIVYIIDDMNFQTSITILEKNCDIRINNCNFYYGMHLSIFNGDGILQYITFNFGPINSIAAENLIIDGSALSGHANYHIGIEVENKLEINDSYINTNKGDIYLSSKDLYLKSASIQGAMVDISARNILAPKSVIEGKELVRIYDNRKMMPTKVEAPVIDYQGEKIYSNEVILKTLNTPLEIKRLELINALKKVLAKCEDNKVAAMTRCEDSLNAKSIARTLKK